MSPPLFPEHFPFVGRPVVIDLAREIRAALRKITVCEVDQAIGADLDLLVLVSCPGRADHDRASPLIDHTGPFADRATITLALVLGSSTAQGQSGSPALNVATRTQPDGSGGTRMGTSGSSRAVFAIETVG